MGRYFLKPVAYEPDDIYPCQPPTIQVDPTEPRPTGIIDHLGRDIWVGPEPIGFRFSENPQ